MSQSTICPYCNTRLRLSSSPSRRTRVKCRKCDRGFHPSQIIEDNGPAQFLNQPLSVPHTPEAPPIAKESPPVATGAPQACDTIAAPEPGTSDPQPAIHPTVSDAAFPAEVLERRAKREEAISRGRERKSRSKHRMKAHELAMVAALLATGLGGAAYLGWYFFSSTKASTRTVDASPKKVETEEFEKTPSLLEADFAAKPLPKSLFGVWELRNDDDRRGWFEFRPDGGMTAQAWVGDDAATPTRDNWFLNKEDGENLVIEVGPQIGVIGNFKYSLTLNGADAFTVTQIAEKDVRYRENQRFVRRTPPKSAAPK